MRASTLQGALARLNRGAPRDPNAKHPVIRPVDSATLVIIDRTGSAPKVLMGKRHAGLTFMPGKFVFPGGRLEAGDRFMRVAGALHPRAEQALMTRVTRPSARRSRALALTAIRETYEETGLLLGMKGSARPDAVPASWAAFGERGIVPDLAGLQVIGRAITPPRRVRRFDTRFFAVDRTAVADEVEWVVRPDAELVELVWVSLAEARGLDLQPITEILLTELEARIAAGFSHELPVPFFYQTRGRRVREEL